MSENVKRVVFVGAGARAWSFARKLLTDYKDITQIMGWCDTSEGMAKSRAGELAEQFGGEAAPFYPAEDFDRMLDETKADIVVVTSRDDTHHEYIAKAAKRGVRIVSEKPMTVDAEKCNFIMDAVGDSRDVRVGFNYRWIPVKTKVKEILMSGRLGKVLSVNVDYLLDTRHGADYFRRWHSTMAHSGGLLVHKSTHHFDLVNWWLDDIPETVMAQGDLVFYGKENAINRGDEKYTRYPRYTGYEEAKDDPFALSMDDSPAMKMLYQDNEEETGYIRDQNVFREGIDIYDTMSVSVRYRSGTLLTYSLNAFSPREGDRVVFNCERGRLEFYDFGGSHIMRGEDDDGVNDEPVHEKGAKRIVEYPHFSEELIEYEIPEATGSHGGGDDLLMEQLFIENPPQDPFFRAAGHQQGAASILVGICANKSIETGKAIKVSEVCPGLPKDATKLSELI